MRWVNFFRINHFILGLGLLLFSCSSKGIANNSIKSSKDGKPNVIFIITDDQGYGDLGYFGNEIIKTPNMDQLFGESVRATTFHVSPNCAPTRAGLMTGRYPNRVGVWHTIAGRSLLFEDEKIIPQIFAENGYKTGLFGKWHLGDNYPLRPQDRGFQETVWHAAGGLTQGPDYWGNDYFDDVLWHNGELRQYEGYITDVIFDESLRFIEENKDRPFFAYISTNAPHSPFHVPEAYYNLYKDEDRLLEGQKKFYGMITNIDDNLLRLEESLEQLGLRDNTILIFMGDNGTSQGYIRRQGEVFGYNAGFRGTKGTIYDGGHRVPFTIRWPDGDIGENRDVDQLLANIDILPTLVDLADLHFVELNPLDGKSFVPLLRGDSEKWMERTLIVDTQRTTNLVKWRNSAVMDDTWRLVNGDELYNIREDKRQSNDVSTEHPEVVSRMRESYDKWWGSFMDQKVNERYAYIVAGTPYENPVRINAHDMHINAPQSGRYWHQTGPLEAARGSGVLKLQIAKDGDYRISLRRYPRESGLAFNQIVEAREQTLEVSNPLPASTQVNMTEATLYLADIHDTKPIGRNDAEITFEGFLHAGKYDMYAFLIDDQGRVYPAYYTYVEKL